MGVRLLSDQKNKKRRQRDAKDENKKNGSQEAEADGNWKVHPSQGWKKTSYDREKRQKTPPPAQAGSSWKR